MSRRASPFIGILALVAFVTFGSTSVSRAESQRQPGFAGTPFDLVNAVNALRASYGLAPYSINSILMYTAQSQADFLAATGSMTHAGPGGIGLTDRLLAAGYPLAGDLSFGGFRSENIAGGSESKPVQAAVDGWTRDSVHLTTMISPDLTEIGAGVAVSEGRVYYVIDCARPTTSGAPPAAATSMDGGVAVPAASREALAVIVPVAMSTPNADGDVIHEVKTGQTLWQIAIAYETKIDQIKNMNSLVGNDIYPGNRLLVKRGVTVPTAFPTETLAQAATSTSLPASIVTAPTVTSTLVLASSSALANNTTIRQVVIGIIVLAVLGGAIFAWLGSSRKE